MTAAAVAGSAVLVMTSLAVGHTAVASRNARIRQTHSLAELVRFIRSNISFFLTPLDGLFAAFDDEYLGKTGFCEILRRDGLDAALKSGSLDLSPETEKIMDRFVSKLGKGLRDEEISLCDYTAGRLSEEERRLCDELERCRDMYRFVPPLGALFVIVCLL